MYSLLQHKPPKFLNFQVHTLPLTKLGMFFLKHHFLGKNEMSFSFDWDQQNISIWSNFKVKAFNWLLLFFLIVCAYSLVKQKPTFWFNLSITNYSIEFIQLNLQMVVLFYIIDTGIRASQQSITANHPPLTTYIHHVMIIVTGSFSRILFYD